MSRIPKWTISEEEGVHFADGAFQRDATVRQLQKEDLTSVFQPIVNLRNGKTFAYEALVRCRVTAFASPLTLFEKATEEEMLGRLGRMVREVTFAMAPPRIPLFVNVHPAELSARWLVRPDDPISLCDNDLFIEVTESATLEHFDLCTSVLREICQRTGAALVIDDLGAGHSNLKRLVDLNPSVVKLDRLLISNIDKNKRQQVLVRHIVDLCIALGAKVVAEGIETVEELQVVRDLGAHLGQGYVLARPAYPPPPVNWPF